uniref:Ig-like domain-containing protein n=1 Tax=Malurus cyaneus samueli TaxID=2593467 RepID=A0A8C5X0G8_9PASS
RASFRKQGCTTASLTFVCPSPPGQALQEKVIRSKVGEKVSLPCCHEIPSSESLHKYRVYWQKNITDVVLAYSEGNMISKHKRYQQRTEMDPRNLTLWISPVEILDNGSYQCVVQRNSMVFLLLNGNQISLASADFSNPNITAEVTADSCDLTEMVIMCTSHGGFPKPKISGALNNVSVEWNASWVSKSSLSPYNVTGKLLLNVTKDVNITCSVEHNGFVKSTSLFLSIDLVCKCLCKDHPVILSVNCKPKYFEACNTAQVGSEL